MPFTWSLLGREDEDEDDETVGYSHDSLGARPRTTQRALDSPDRMAGRRHSAKDTSASKHKSHRDDMSHEYQKSDAIHECSKLPSGPSVLHTSSRSKSAIELHILPALLHILSWSLLAFLVSAIVPYVALLLETLKKELLVMTKGCMV